MTMTATATGTTAMTSSRIRLGVAALTALVLFVQVPAASAQPVSFRDTFRIGSGSGLLCTAQTMVSGPALTDMFDRGYTIVCRDAAAPVGQIYALRTRDGDPLARLAALRAGRVTCEPAVATEIENVGAVETWSCRLDNGEVPWRVYARRAANVVYVAEGLGGYDSALQLGLRSVVADREVEGELSIATTGAGDPSAFARAQAGALHPQRALAEAYRRNNSGNYAESAEFFGQLTTRDDSPAGRAEALANEGVQKSNLGRYGEADALFGRAEAL